MRYEEAQLRNLSVLRRAILSGQVSSSVRIKDHAVDAKTYIYGFIRLLKSCNSLSCMWFGC